MAAQRRLGRRGLTLAFGFTRAHRDGAGPPLVCLHGFTDTWGTWQLVLPALERRHDVLALTLPGHAGGPPLSSHATEAALLDEVERTVDETLDHFTRMDNSLRSLAPHADAIVSTREGRRRATAFTSVSFEHIPPELLAHQICGVAACSALEPLLERARRREWDLDAERIACPVRIVWGTEDRLLPWPSSATRYRDDWLPHADWIVLDGVGHCPQLDVPLETAQLILGVTSP